MALFHIGDDYPAVMNFKARLGHLGAVRRYRIETAPFAVEATVSLPEGFAFGRRQAAPLLVGYEP